MYRPVFGLEKFASPILPRAGRWLDFVSAGQTVGLVNAQTLEARLGPLRAGVADADVPFECRVHCQAPAAESPQVSGTDSN